MKKKLFLIVLIILVIYIGTTFGQPTPGDGGLGAASGNPVGHGGGADLGQNVVIFIVAALAYAFYKLREQFSSLFSLLKV